MQSIVLKAADDIKVKKTPPYFQTSLQSSRGGKKVNRNTGQSEVGRLVDISQKSAVEDQRNGDLI